LKLGQLRTQPDAWRPQGPAGTDMAAAIPSFGDSADILVDEAAREVLRSGVPGGVRLDQ
tara:strand:- start:344 stop:520 length:177 start_codon:yes stop_codon:yes gene_type:complete